MSILNVTNLSAGYDRKTVIEGINFTIEEGNIVGIIGANGSGKTTLLKAVAGLLPCHGSCSILGEDVSKISKKELALHCGYIPQKSGISISLSVLDVVLMGFNPMLKLLQSPTKQMTADALELMAYVGLLGPDNPEICPETSFLELSEGQKQLCILARTFVCKRALLLLDEPESALDFRMRHHTMELLREYVSANNAGALISLHDSSLALNCCDKLLILSGHKLIGQINPKEDTINEMQLLLSQVYGSVSLHKIMRQDGNDVLAMLKEA